MEFYSKNDLPYWRKQAEQGKAVIIEIPVEMLLELDIGVLSEKYGPKISPEELSAWIEENKEDMLKAAEPDPQIEKTVTALGEDDPIISEDSSQEQKVSRIMETVDFTSEQMEVITEAMVLELPAKYLLCLMKKDYSPESMRKVLAYCLRMHNEETMGVNTPRKGE